MGGEKKIVGGERVLWIAVAAINPVKYSPRLGKIKTEVLHAVPIESKQIRKFKTREQTRNLARFIR